jgi:hypothetical protein
MSHILSLGAIHKHTGEHICPNLANKTDEYICPTCHKDLILCQGEIRICHFRHKVDSINPCNHYSNPTETQIHKDAKLLLKTLLERKIPITFIRTCIYCKTDEEYEIPEITKTSIIYIEYRFDFNGQKIADVAYIDNGEILCIFEICNTHKTSSENRPEPWFEINAQKLINAANDIQFTSFQIPCMRCEKCENCIEKENNMKLQKIDRIKKEKIEKIKKQIDECKKSFVPVDPDWMYEDNKSQKKQLARLYTELSFIENEIEYVESKTNIYEITHPLTNQKIKLTSNDKAFVNGKWIDIHFTDIKKWNKNDKNNIIDSDNLKKDFANSGTTLKYAFTARNKTERKNLLSKFLQSDNIGELNESDKYYFTQMYCNFYSYEDGRPKFNIDDIQKVSIEKGDYGSKCFNISVDNQKYIISIKRFTN